MTTQSKLAPLRGVRLSPQGVEIYPPEIKDRAPHYLEHWRSLSDAQKLQRKGATLSELAGLTGRMKTDVIDELYSGGMQ